MVWDGEDNARDVRYDASTTGVERGLLAIPRRYQASNFCQLTSGASSESSFASPLIPMVSYSQNEVWKSRRFARVTSQYEWSDVELMSIVNRLKLKLISTGETMGIIMARIFQARQ